MARSPIPQALRLDRSSWGDRYQNLAGALDKAVSDLASATDEVTKDLSVNDPPRNELVHYTRSSTGISILENKQIWAGHASFMNDKNELVEGANELRAMLQAGISAYKIPGDELEPLEESLRITLSKLAARAETDTLARDTFIASLTDNDDDLNQWYRYGDGHRGLCVRLHVKELLQDDGTAVSLSGPILLRVIYDRAHRRRLCESLSQALVPTLSLCFLIAALMEQEGKTNNDDYSKIRDFGSQVLEQFIGAYVLVSAAFKRPEFASEREWRLVWSRPSHKWHELNKLYRRRGNRAGPAKLEDARFRGLKFTDHEQRGVVPAVAWDIKDSICGVTLGSERASEENQQAVRFLLRSVGLGEIAEAVHACDSSFRP